MSKTAGKTFEHKNFQRCPSQHQQVHGCTPPDVQEEVTSEKHESYNEDACKDDPSPSQPFLQTAFSDHLEAIQCDIKTLYKVGTLSNNEELRRYKASAWLQQRPKALLSLSHFDDVWIL